MLFTNRFVIHLIIILIALSVTTSNLLAYEKKDNYGQNALIYKMVGQDTVETIEDTTTSLEVPKVSSYLGESFQLESGVFSEAQKKAEDLYNQEYNSYISTTEGGVTLVKPDLVSTEGAKATRTSIREYVVGSGDSIGSIASQFRISINTVLWANNLSANSYIKPGQKLIIPPTSGVLHKIAKGDTIKSIAKKYGAIESSIKDFNNIKNDSILVVGDILMVPGGQIITTYKSRVYTPPSQLPAYTPPVARTVASGQMLWPNGCRRITQPFKGWLHTGVDIACSYGTPVVAAEDGVVSRVQYGSTGYGYNIILDHGNGIQTLYGHLSWIGVVQGQHISQGEVMAREGSTGRSTGPHLHFEVRVNGQRVNPLNYIR